MTSKTELILLSILLLVIAVLVKINTPTNNSIDINTISVPVFADNYIIKTTVVNGETATIYYTSYSPSKGKEMTITLLPQAALTKETDYWYSDGKWYYVSGALVMTTSFYPHQSIITIQMVLSVGALVFYSNGTKYTPYGKLSKTISIFTITNDNTTIEYTILHGKYAKLMRT